MDKKQTMIDLGILVVIIVAVYFLSQNSAGTTFGPSDILNIFG